VRRITLWGDGRTLPGKALEPGECLSHPLQHSIVQRHVRSRRTQGWIEHDHVHLPSAAAGVPADKDGEMGELRMLSQHGRQDAGDRLARGVAFAGRDGAIQENPQSAHLRTWFVV